MSISINNSNLSLLYVRILTSCLNLVVTGDHIRPWGPTVYSGADQRKHQSSASLAFVRGIHRVPMNSPHKGPVTRQMAPFDDVIMRDGNESKDNLTCGTFAA